MQATVELYGFPYHVAYVMEQDLKKSIALVPHIKNVRIVIIDSTVRDANTSAPEPFVRLVAEKKSRAALIKILTRLKQNIQVVDQAQWIPKS